MSSKIKSSSCMSMGHVLNKIAPPLSLCLSPVSDCFDLPSHRFDCLSSLSPSGLFLGWRWLAVTSSVPPALMLVLMCFMPETPHYLLAQGRRAEAQEALRFLRGPDASPEEECARIEGAMQDQVTMLSVNK